MTNTTKTPVRMVMATRTLQQVPFQLGGKTFVSRRLTAEEEIVYEHVSLYAPFIRNAMERYQASVEVLTNFLRKRQAGEQTEGINEDWVASVLNPDTEKNLMAYLRTGHNGPGLVLAPEETFDLPAIELEWDDGHQFAGVTLNYAELRDLDRGVSLEALESMNRLGKVDDDNLDVDQLRQTSLEMVEQIGGVKRQQADAMAAALNARLRQGDPVDGQWLLDTFTTEDLTHLQKYLRTGEVPQEGDTPNADPTPANLPINS